MWNQNEREQRILERIKSIQKKTKRVVVRKPKKGLSKQEKAILDVIDSKDKATVRLDKVLKLIK